MLKKKNLTSRSTGSESNKFSRPILCGGICFLFWLLLFILTDIYISNPLGFGKGHTTFLRVFQYRFHKADFGTYTFEEGMGMSVFRLYLSGFGGILSFPASLLPSSVHPQVASVLDALRLGLSGAVFSYFLSSVFPEKAESEKKKGPFSFRLIFLLSGVAYTAVCFILSLLLRFPVADTFFLLPLSVLFLRRDKKAGRFSILLLFILFSTLVSSAAWALISIPVLLICCFFQRSSGSEKRKTLQVLLSLGLSAFILLPQFLQMPYAVSGEPSSAFLSELGNDTGKYKSDVTFHSEATAALLNTSPSLLSIERQTEETGAIRPSDYATYFSFLNEWFYSLWPSLPILPFQDTSANGPTTDAVGSISYSITTTFIDPLYCAVKLPNRKGSVDILVNERKISTISHSKNTVLIDLGKYNAGQNLTVTLRSSRSDDLIGAAADFGYLNSINWNVYTRESNFGISSLELNKDGITAEALIGSDVTILSNIPYEKGWSLYVNGSKTPIKAYRDAWICTDLSAGNYFLHLHYTAPGSTWGGWISGLSFLLLAIFCLRPDHSSSSEAPEMTSSSGASSKIL